jgi:hypothetical protein
MTLQDDPMAAQYWKCCIAHLRQAALGAISHVEVRVLNLSYFCSGSAMHSAMQLKAWNLLAKVVAAISVMALLVSLCSFDSQTLQSPSRHDIETADVPTVAYAISLTRVPEGLEGHTFLDAVEVSK